MDSKVSMSKSATNCIEYPSGVTLKSRKLKYWIKQKGLTQSYVAHELQMSKRQLRNKLYWRKTFNQQEITQLVNLLGARIAIQVIWFPTLKEKKRVRRIVWEDKMENYQDYETERENKSRRLAELSEECGENWEQSQAFEDYLFNSDELPSRKFMRRRCDVR